MVRDFPLQFPLHKESSNTKNKKWNWGKCLFCCLKPSLGIHAE